jgi:carbon-monoxide dehydrogenase iron sulfur subunit
MATRKEIFAKPERCTGCMSCVIACGVEHSQGKSLFAACTEKPAPRSRVYVEWSAPERKTPILCRHCDDAPCMHACIVGAITQGEDGVVTTDTDRCIGCWTCVMVCPYGVIGRHAELKKSYRCDRCPGRELPACVSSCPTGALVFGSVDEFSKGARQTAAEEFAKGERK